MANTDSLVQISDAMMKLFEQHTEFGFEDVWYGDQDLIPRTPALAIEPGDVQRELRGIATGGMTQNDMTAFLFIYHNPVQSPQTTRKECDQLAELVVATLHSDVTLGGLVIHGFCRASESGFAVRGGAMLRAHRVTWTGTSKTRLTP